MQRLEKRLARLEQPAGAEPAMEDWLAVLEADDQAAALADLERRFPGVRSKNYRAAIDALA